MHAGRYGCQAHRADQSHFEADFVLREVWGTQRLLDRGWCGEARAEAIASEIQSHVLKQGVAASGGQIDIHEQKGRQRAGSSTGLRLEISNRRADVDCDLGNEHSLVLPEGLADRGSQYFHLLFGGRRRVFDQARALAHLSWEGQFEGQEAAEGRQGREEGEAQGGEWIAGWGGPQPNAGLFLPEGQHPRPSGRCPTLKH